MNFEVIKAVVVLMFRLLFYLLLLTDFSAGFQFDKAEKQQQLC